MRLHLERRWKHKVEERVVNLLSPTKLVPEQAGTMERMMKLTDRHFVNPELHSEIAVSIGAAAAAMENGYSGIVNISPFACLIGRVIEGIFTPWARTRRYPVLSVEVDGNQLPPSILSRLDVFAVNVVRFRQDVETSALVSSPATEPAAPEAASCTEDPLHPEQAPRRGS